MHMAIVIPFLDEERYLGRTLGTLAAQRRPPDAVLLVDDGSSDGSPALAAAFAAAHPWARVLRRPRRARGADRLGRGPARGPLPVGGGAPRPPSRGGWSGSRPAGTWSSSSTPTSCCPRGPSRRWRAGSPLIPPSGS